MAGEIIASQLGTASVTAAKLNNDIGWHGPVEVSVGAAHASQVSVAIKMVNQVLGDFESVTAFRWWLSSDNTTGAIHGTAPSVDTTFTTGLAISEDVAGLAGNAITDASGDAVMLVDHAADAQDYYLWVFAGGLALTTAKIEIT